MSKDYYKILGVTEFESAENIKAAYRNLARKFHPDIAGNTEDVILKFKEINEAYQVLSNKVKKEEYDRARRFYSYAQGVKPQAEKKEQETTKTNSDNSFTGKKGFNFSWEEIMFGRKRNESCNSKKEKTPVKGEDIYTEIQITIFEALQGAQKVINMLQTGVCPNCGGRKFVNGTLCSHCHGKGEYSEYKKFTVKIPAGIKNRSKIRLAGEGAKGINGGRNGDLYVTVNIKEPQNCKTEGLNIYKTISINPSEAVLGTEIKVSSLSGTYTVKIMPNTQNGQKIRLSRCGIVQNEKVGDMIITVEIKIPKNLSEEEILLYKKLAELREGNSGNSIYDR